MVEAVLTGCIIFTYLVMLHLVDIKLDEKHSISLLQLIALKSLGAKVIYYKD